MEETIVATATKTDRIDLKVPFPAAEYVRACGAYWDWKKKVWYTYGGHHNAKSLKRFMTPEAAAKVL